MPYTIVECERDETITPDGVTTIREFLVSPYSARGEAYADLVGGVKLIGGRLIRIPPMSDPAYPQARVSEIRCRKIDDDTLDGAAIGSGYNPLVRHAAYRNAARLVVTYKTPSNSPSDPLGPNDQQTIDNASGEGVGDLQELELATQAWDYSSQQLTLSGDRFGWQRIDAPTEPPNELLQNEQIAVTKTIPRVEISLERKFVLRLPQLAISALQNRINTAPFTIGYDTYPAETLRFDGAQVRQALTNLGLKFYNVTYKFSCFSTYDDYEADNEFGYDTGYVGWNRLFDPRTVLWRRVTALGNPTRGIHLLDGGYSKTLAGRVIKGFRNLFHPLAR